MGPRVLKTRINLCLLAALALNLAFWWGSRHFIAHWAGVPPVPSPESATAMTLGDSEFSYRTGALTLQNLGDTGGRTTPLADYDYEALGRWFRLLDGLDPVSEHVPAIAAYYFGAVRDKPEASAVIVDYLAHVGRRPFGEKWRWLAYAAMLSQHRAHDLDRALEIATMLSNMKLADGTQLPGFAREYPAFILHAQGENEAAKKLMLEVLAVEKNRNEARFIKDYLLNRLGADAGEVAAAMRQRRENVKD